MMLARTILPAKKHDNMDSMVQLNGPGGNGKSVALGVVQLSGARQIQARPQQRPKTVSLRAGCQPIHTKVKMVRDIQ